MAPNDLKQIDDLLQKRLRTEITASEKRLRGGITTIDKNLSGKIMSSEQRLRVEMVTSEQGLEGALKQLSKDVGDFISDRVIPLIDEKADKSDIERLEGKVDRALDTLMDHESRIRDKEYSPVVAHDLKQKKSR